MWLGDRLDMAVAVDWDVKPHAKQTYGFKAASSESVKKQTSFVVIGASVSVNSAYWVLWHSFLSSKINFFQTFFQKSTRVSNSLEPDLGPKCSQRSEP